jgi:cyclophilin family peptidyl-prolyl cis-trans isomerase
MTRGLVGWAAGDTGPDFFITTNKEPVTAWGQTHTVFGQVQDETSFAVIDKIYSLPTTKKGVTMLIDKIKFTLSME